MIILKVKDIVKRFGGNTVLNDCSLELDEGKIYQLIGPNGSGKTTLINTIAGMYKPNKGKVMFKDIDITNMDPYHTFMAGLVRTWQIPQPFIELTTRENMMVAKSGKGESFGTVMLPTKWSGEEFTNDISSTDVLKMINLIKKDGIQSKGLSGGQQKLLELGRAIMTNVKLILMDEPIAGVNPTLAHEIFDQITNMCRKENITFLIVEHRLDISLQYTDHVFAMNNGTIIAEGDSEEILKHPKVIESYIGK